MKIRFPSDARLCGQGIIRVAVVFVLTLCGCAGERTGDRLLVTAGGSDHVFVLDARSGEIIDSIAVDPRPGESDEPHGIERSPTGDHWYVTVSHGEPTLWKFTLPDNRRVGRVRLGISGASRIGISPDGLTGFVPDYYRDNRAIPGRIAVVELRDLSILAEPEVCGAPHDAQVSPSGHLLAVACSGSDELVFVDTQTLEVTKRITFGSATAMHAKPMNLVWLDSDSHVAVSLHGHNAIVRCSAEGEVTDRMGVGAEPAQLAMSPNRRTLVSANRGDGTVSVISLETMAETNRFELDVPHPHGVAFDGTGTIAFITYEGAVDTHGGVLALDVSTGTVLWNQKTGTFTLGVTRITHK